MVVGDGSCRVVGFPHRDDTPPWQIVSIPDPQASAADEAPGRHRGGESIQFGNGKQDRRPARRSEETTTDRSEVVEGQGTRMTCGPFGRIGRRRLVLEEGRVAEDVIVVTVAASGPCTDVRTIHRDALPEVRCSDVVRRIGTGSFVDVDGIDAGVGESLGGHEGQKARTRADIENRRCIVERRPCTEDAGILRDLHRSAMLMDGEGAHGEETGRHG